MKLIDTIPLMQSSDYKDRFLAEYYQVKIRYDKLMIMLEKWYKGKLNFTPTCSRDIYEFQSLWMENYIEILKKRAKLENIELKETTND